MEGKVRKWRAKVSEWRWKARLAGKVSRGGPRLVNGGGRQG